MLLNFTVENWMSFRDETSFSMVASEETLHKERVPRLGEHDTSVLPISTVFGGNASGKSNFFNAINYARELVIYGRVDSGIIPLSPFKLDPEFENSETKFSFEILTAGKLYEYDFAVFRQEVTNEKMSIVQSGKPVKLYERLKNGKINLNQPLEEREYVKLISQNIPKSELFLNNVMRFGQNESWPVFDWFKDSLTLIKAETIPPIRLLDYGLAGLNDVLPLIDCGIKRIDRRRNDSILEYLFSTPHIKRRLENLSEGESYRRIREGIVVTKINGELVAEKLNLIHPGSEGNDVKFEFSEESDGTKRTLDLLPGFLELSSPDSSKVYIIDELDRSLHTRLVHELISAYLKNCTPVTRSQLIFTAHDVMLLNTELLRRDEMWISRRLNNGSTDLISIGDFDEANEDRIYLDYLQGFLGGLPNVMLGGINLNSKKRDIK